MHYFFAVVLILTLTHCSSKKDVNVSLDEAPKFDKTLNSATTNRTEKVGVKDDTVKIQRILYLEEDLAKKQREIEDLENDVFGQSKLYPGGLWSSLKTCRGKLSDQRLGGTGVPEPMEKWDKVSEKDEDYNYHVDKNNNVVAVAEEELATRISNLKKLKRVVNDTYDAFKTKLDNCEQKYQTALINTGINPADTKAQGEWVEGPNGYKIWKMRKPASADPEELMKRQADKAKTTDNKE